MPTAARTESARSAEAWSQGKKRALLLGIAGAVLVAGIAYWSVHHDVPSTQHPSAQSLPAPPSIVSQSAATTAPQPPANPLLAEAFALPRGASDAERLRLVNAMAKLGPGAIEELGAAFRTAPTLTAKAAFAEALAKIGTSEAVDRLVTDLQTLPNAAQRATLGSAFRAMSNPAGLETLTSALATINDPSLRQSLAGAVGSLASADTVQYMAELYREAPSNPAQPDNMAAALAGITNSAATSALHQLVTDAPEIPLQAAAAKALSQIGTPEALDGLVSGLLRVGDTNPALRQSFLTALQNVTNREAQSWLSTQSASPNMPVDMAAAMNQALLHLRSR